MTNSLKKLITAILSSILVIIILLALLYYFYKAYIINKFNNIRDTQAGIVLADKELESLVDFTNFLKDNDSKVQIIKDSFLSNNDDAIVNFIELLEYSAESLSLSIDITSADLNYDVSQYPAKFTFNVNGNFNNIMDFIALIESAKVFAKFEAVDITKDSKGIRLKADLSVASL